MPGPLVLDLVRAEEAFYTPNKGTTLLSFNGTWYKTDGITPTGVTSAVDDENEFDIGSSAANVNTSNVAGHNGSDIISRTYPDRNIKFTIILEAPDTQSLKSAVSAVSAVINEATEYHLSAFKNNGLGPTIGYPVFLKYMTDSTAEPRYFLIKSGSLDLSDFNDQVHLLNHTAYIGVDLVTEYAGYGPASYLENKAANGTFAFGFKHWEADCNYRKYEDVKGLGYYQQDEGFGAMLMTDDNFRSMNGQALPKNVEYGYDHFMSHSQELPYFARWKGYISQSYPDYDASIIYDDFQRASLGSTPSGNKTWIQDKGSWTLNGNRLTNTSDANYDMVSFDCSSTYNYISADVTGQNGAAFRNLYLLLNSTGSGNAVGIGVENTTFYLKSFNPGAGTSTNLESIAITGIDTSAGARFNLALAWEVLTYNSSAFSPILTTVTVMKGYLNGKEMFCKFFNGNYSTGTKAGLLLAKTGSPAAGSAYCYNIRATKRPSEPAYQNVLTDSFFRPSGVSGLPVVNDLVFNGTETGQVWRYGQGTFQYVDQIFPTATYQGTTPQILSMPNRASISGVVVSTTRVSGDRALVRGVEVGKVSCIINGRIADDTNAAVPCLVIKAKDINNMLYIRYANSKLQMRKIVAGTDSLIEEFTGQTTTNFKNYKLEANIRQYDTLIYVNDAFVAQIQHGAFGTTTSPYNTFFQPDYNYQGILYYQIGSPASSLTLYPYWDKFRIEVPVSPVVYDSFKRLGSSSTANTVSISDSGHNYYKYNNSTWQTDASGLYCTSEFANDMIFFTGSHRDATLEVTVNGHLTGANLRTPRIILRGRDKESFLYVMPKDNGLYLGYQEYNWSGGTYNYTDNAVYINLPFAFTNGADFKISTKMNGGEFTFTVTRLSDNTVASYTIDLNNYPALKKYNQAGYFYQGIAWNKVGAPSTNLRIKNLKIVPMERIYSRPFYIPDAGSNGGKVWLSGEFRDMGADIAEFVTLMLEEYDETNRMWVEVGQRIKMGQAFSWTRFAADNPINVDNAIVRVKATVSAGMNQYFGKLADIRKIAAWYWPKSMEDFIALPDEYMSQPYTIGEYAILSGLKGTLETNARIKVNNPKIVEDGWYAYTNNYQEINIGLRKYLGEPAPHRIKYRDTAAADPVVIANSDYATFDLNAREYRVFIRCATDGAYNMRLGLTSTNSVNPLWTIVPNAMFYQLPATGGAWRTYDLGTLMLPPYTAKSSAKAVKDDYYNYSSNPSTISLQPTIDQIAGQTYTGAGAFVDAIYFIPTDQFNYLNTRAAYGMTSLESLPCWTNAKGTGLVIDSLFKETPSYYFGSPKEADYQTFQMNPTATMNPMRLYPATEHSPEPMVINALIRRQDETTAPPNGSPHLNTFDDDGISYGVLYCPAYDF